MHPVNNVIWGEMLIETRRADIENGLLGINKRLLTM